MNRIFSTPHLCNFYHTKKVRGSTPWSSTFYLPSPAGGIIYDRGWQLAGYTSLFYGVGLFSIWRFWLAHPTAVTMLDTNSNRPTAASQENQKPMTKNIFECRQKCRSNYIEFLRGVFNRSTCKLYILSSRQFGLSLPLLILRSLGSSKIPQYSGLPRLVPRCCCAFGVGAHFRSTIWRSGGGNKEGWIWCAPLR